MKEQIDIFTQDILKLKDEKEAILKENKQKDEVIEELNRNANAWRSQLLDYEEKFEACKQAVSLFAFHLNLLFNILIFSLLYPTN